MSRTYRKPNPKMKHQTKNGLVKDGTAQHISPSCSNNGGCPICEGNRLHKHKKKKSVDNILE